MSTTAAGAAREGTGVMDDEVTRLRALCEGIALPLSSAQTDSTAIELSDAEGVYIGSVDIDDGPLFDASEATEATAALIVAAVNALPALLDRVEAAERERDSLRAQLDTVATAYRALLAGQPVPEYSGPALSEQGRATLDRLRPRREMGSEAQRLREIIAGRTTPPTDAEIAPLRSRVDALETALRDVCEAHRVEMIGPPGHAGAACDWCYPGGGVSRAWPCESAECPVGRAFAALRNTMQGGEHEQG